MRAPTGQYQALVLRTVPYGESDLVVHLFCRGRGRLAAFARGARKSVKRFGGGIEPFTLLQVEVQERRSGDLLDFKAATIVDPHLELRSDLSRLAHAGYATELCRELLHDNEPNDRLFQLLLEYFKVLARSGPRSLSLRAFELGAVGAAGLSPQLDHCAACGGELGEVAQLAFDPSLGGIACQRCETEFAIWIDQPTLRTLKGLQAGGLEASEHAQDEGLPLEAVRRAMRAFVDRHVSHDLRSLSFLREVGAPL